MWQCHRVVPGFVFRWCPSSYSWHILCLVYFLHMSVENNWILKYVSCVIACITVALCRSQWPRGLRRRSAAARLLRSWVRVPPGAWMSVCCECYVLSYRGLCDELITRPEESYRLCCVVVCDLEMSRMREPWPALARSATGIKNKYCGPPVRLSWMSQLTHVYTLPTVG